MSEASSLQLLQICDLAKQWPNLQALHDVAMADLVAMNEDAKAELAKRAKVKAEKEAAEQAAAAAKVKAAAERLARQSEPSTNANVNVTDPAPTIERRD